MVGHCRLPCVFPQATSAPIMSTSVIHASHANEMWWSVVGPDCNTVLSHYRVSYRVFGWGGGGGGGGRWAIKAPLPDLTPAK